MKKIFLLFFITLNAEAATLCEVYGISDSPQGLNCIFARKKHDLTCKDGTYFLGHETVEAAFHYEVEDGPVPLVFKTKTRELTVTLDSGKQHRATLFLGGKKLRGNCRL